MGNSQQKGVAKGEGEELPKISHQRFANRQIVRKGEEETIVIKVAVPHQKEYTNWAEQLAKVGRQEALLLPLSHSFAKEGFCGLSGTADIIYENYPFLLSDEIHNRECLGTKFFEENQLWYLVLTLLTAADFFHIQGRKVGDVRPENVFISEDGSVKVACTYSWPLQRTNYEKSFQKQVTFLSPEEVEEMGYGKTEPSAAFDLAETFSIGLTLLDAATLSDSKDLYKGHKSFDYATLQDRMRELHSKQEYSRLLKTLIQNMCEVTSRDRTPSRQLYDWLSPFEEEINNFQEFETGQLPEKLKSCYDKLYNQGPPTVNNSIQYNSVPQNNIYNSQPPQNNPPREIREHLQQRVQYNTYVPNRTTVSTSNPSQQGPIGFSYQESGSSGQRPISSYVPPQSSIMTTFNPQPNPTYVTSTNPMPVTSQPTQLTSQTYHPNQSQQVVESTYVPFNGKFSLDKIDEQLQQSRKMFPS